MSLVRNIRPTSDPFQQQQTATKRLGPAQAIEKGLAELFRVVSFH